jgi:hypothetical protein
MEMSITLDEKRTRHMIALQQRVSLEHLLNTKKNVLECLQENKVNESQVMIF